MDESTKKIIEDHFSKVSIILTELGRISPGCSLIYDADRIEHYPPNKNVTMSFDEYFQIVSSLALSSNAKYLILGCEQTINDEKYLSIVCYPTDENENHTMLCSKILSDPRGVKYTTDEKEWIFPEEGSEIDIEVY